MATTVSTTALTPADIQLLTECSAHIQCTGLASQITRLQAQVAQLQARKVTADAAFQGVMKTVLTSKSVSVPDGSTIIRQANNLLVQTP